MEQRLAEPAEALQERTEADTALSAWASQLAQYAVAAEDELRAVRSSSEGSTSRGSRCGRSNSFRLRMGALGQQLRVLGKL